MKEKKKTFYYQKLPEKLFKDLTSKVLEEGMFILLQRKN